MNLYFFTLIIACSGLLFGYDTGIIADTHWQISQAFQLTPLLWSVVVSSMILGAFFGSAVSGHWVDKLGRKLTLQYTALAFVLGTLIVTTARGYESLVVGRFILGCSIGLSSYCAPLYISEIAPAKNRGMLVLFNNVAITGGEAIAFLTGYLIHDTQTQSWRLMFFMGMVPALILLVGLRFLPASPRWLMMKNQPSLAKKSLLQLRGEGDHITEEFNGIQSTINPHAKPKFKHLFQRSYRMMLIIGLALGILQQTSGINIVMYFGPFVFHQSGFSQDHAMLASFFIGLTNALFTFIALLTIDKLGRRLLMIVGPCLAGMALITLAASFSFQQLNHWVGFVSLLIYTMAFAMSLGCGFWLIISEIYPIEIRGLAMSVVTSVQWLANFLVSLCFLPAFNLLGGGVTMMISAGFCFLSAWFCFKFLPETRGISLETMAQTMNQELRDENRHHRYRTHREVTC